MNITRCNATVDPTCAPDLNFTMIESAFKQFLLWTPVINVNINPGSSEYKTFYFEDQNYFTFSSNIGISAFAMIE
jgi:hypothetical protein